MTNFIEEQQKRMKQAFRDASYWENPNPRERSKATL